MYGLAGERHLVEWEADWLPGYQGARPVRIGNAAHDQLQLDVYGEVADALHQARAGGLAAVSESWQLQRKLTSHLADIWDQPDEGIWETRGGRRHFTHSKVMAWVAIDRAVRSAERFGLAAIERDLLVDGFVRRYDTADGKDGLAPGEGAFLACSFWLADNYVLQGRLSEARALFDRLLALRNDVGLLAEEYDPQARRQVGNFPQAFSHIALVNTALKLAGA